MADITGYYDLFENGTKIELQIAAVDSNGNLASATLGGREVYGFYNQSAKSISFSTQRPDPKKVVLDFYTGQVFIDGKTGLPVGMSGIHHRNSLHPPQMPGSPQTPWLAVYQGRIIG